MRTVMWWLGGRKWLVVVLGGIGLFYLCLCAIRAGLEACAISLAGFFSALIMAYCHFNTKQKADAEETKVSMAAVANGKLADAIGINTGDDTCYEDDDVDTTIRDGKVGF